MQGDTVLFERYFNGQRPRDRHIMFSVTKSLIGTLGEQLVCDGVLNPTLPAAYYVPELVGSAFGDATVRQLFDMAVGIDYSEVYDDPNSESSQYGYACGFQPAPAQYAQFESLYQYLPSLKKRGTHGGFFSLRDRYHRSLGLGHGARLGQGLRSVTARHLEPVGV